MNDAWLREQLVRRRVELEHDISTAHMRAAEMRTLAIHRRHGSEDRPVRTRHPARRHTNHVNRRPRSRANKMRALSRQSIAMRPFSVPICHCAKTVHRRCNAV
jgi:hypothetical protein